jgi:hypothetical protein
MPGPWINLPLAAPDETPQFVRSIPWIYQFYEALVERDWVRGLERAWPGQSSTWDAGGGDGERRITAATNTLLTFSGSDPPVWNGTGNNPFAKDGSSSGDNPWTPTDYDVVIEVGAVPVTGTEKYDKWILPQINPEKLVRAHITGHTANTLTIETIADYTTEGVLPNGPSDLVGCRAFILRHHETWWHLERWPAWANAPEVTKGSCTLAIPGGEGSPPAPGKIQDPTKKWIPGQFEATPDASYVLVTRVFGGGPGSLRRIPIIGNTRTELLFAPVDFQPWIGRYAVVKADAEGDPITPYRLGKEVHEPFCCYRGALDSWWSHPVEYSWGGSYQLATTPQPAATVTWNDAVAGIGLVCADVAHPALNNGEVWSDLENLCGEPFEVLFSPHYYKTWEGIQGRIESLAGHFVEVKTYSGNMDGLPKYCLATLFTVANVNPFTTTVAEEGGTRSSLLVGEIDAPYYPIDVFFAVDGLYDAGGDYEWTGVATFSDSSTFEVVSFDAVGGNEFSTEAVDAEDPRTVIGKTLRCSYGWSDYHELAFKHIRPRAAWVADLKPVDEGGGAQDPAEVIDWDQYGALGVGKWVYRGASVDYFPAYGAAPAPGAVNFKPGELARYIGNNWNDAVDGGNAFVSLIVDPQLYYFDRFYEGRHPSQIEVDKIDAQTYGISSGGSLYSLTDSSKDWWRDQWYPGGVLHVESGVAGGGSTAAKMRDVNKRAGHESGAFWFGDDGTRFEGAGITGPYQYFVLESEFAKDVWEKRPVVSGSIDATAAEATVFAGNPFPGSLSGKPWRIREPAYNLNRWRRLVIEMVSPDGSKTYRRQCAVSDDNTIWWEVALPEPIGAGWRYKIHDPKPGSVWRFSQDEPALGIPYMQIGENAFWVAPRGEDVARLGVKPPQSPQNFHVKQSENLPTIVKRYGRMRPASLVDHPEFYNQMYRAINALVWTKSSVAYYQHAVDGTPGPLPVGGGNFVEEGSRDQAAERANYVSGWASYGVGEGSAGPPYGFVSYEVDEEFININGEKHSAYADVVDPPKIAFDRFGFQHSTEAWSKTSRFFGFLTDPPEDGADANGEVDRTDAAARHTLKFDGGGSGFARDTWSKLGGAAEGADFARVFIGQDCSTPFPLGRDLVWNDVTDFPFTYPGDRFDGVDLGWAVVDTRALLKWDGANGLTYKAP